MTIISSIDSRLSPRKRNFEFTEQSWQADSGEGDSCPPGIILSEVGIHQQYIQTQVHGGQQNIIDYQM